MRWVTEGILVLTADWRGYFKIINYGVPLNGTLKWAIL